MRNPVSLRIAYRRVYGFPLMGYSRNPFVVRCVAHLDADAPLALLPTPANTHVPAIPRESSALSTRAVSSQQQPKSRIFEESHPRTHTHVPGTRGGKVDNAENLTIVTAVYEGIS
jgi:hypothetical protein